MMAALMPTSQSPLKILFVRLDRIGDLVLSLPVDEAFSSAKAHWWIPQGLQFVADHARPRRDARELPKKIGVAAFFRLLQETRKRRYDRAVVFHAPWWVGCLLWLAGIPIRVGVRSQWHSFLFFNRGVRQKRSRAETSELEYNYRLVEEGFRISELERRTLKLEGHVPPGEEANFLAKFGLRPGGYSVVHPGMGASARNWPTERYAELIQRLPDDFIVVTGTAADDTYLKPLKMLLDSPKIVWLNERLKGPELLTVLACARTVTAPSTGVLHLAASTGVQTLGIFSPVRVQRPRRWGPQGPKTNVLTPNVECPGELECLGPACPKFDCMPLIAVDSALRSLNEEKLG